MYLRVAYSYLVYMLLHMCVCVHTALTSLVCNIILTTVL